MFLGSVITIGVTFYYGFEKQAQKKNRIAEVSQTIAQSRRDAILISDNIVAIKAKILTITDIDLKDSAIRQLSNATEMVNDVVTQLNEIYNVLSDRKSQFDPMTIIQSCDAARLDIAKTQGMISLLPLYKDDQGLQKLFTQNIELLATISSNIYEALVLPALPKAGAVQKSELTPPFRGLEFITVGYAQTSDATVKGNNSGSTPGLHVTQDDAKMYIFLGIFIVLFITFISVIIAIFSTTNAQVFAFALDTVKTLLGFLSARQPHFWGCRLYISRR